MKTKVRWAERERKRGESALLGERKREREAPRMKRFSRLLNLAFSFHQTNTSTEDHDDGADDLLASGRRLEDLSEDDFEARGSSDDDSGSGSGSDDGGRRRERKRPTAAAAALAPLITPPLRSSRPPPDLSPAALRAQLAAWLDGEAKEDDEEESESDSEPEGEEEATATAAGGATKNEERPEKEEKKKKKPSFRPLECSACPGVLLAGAAAARQHVASKAHARRVRAKKPESFSALAPSEAGAAEKQQRLLLLRSTLRFRAPKEADETETHAERTQRVALEAAAARKRLERQKEEDEREKERKRRPGKRPGKRQRLSWNGKEKEKEAKEKKKETKNAAAAAAPPSTPNKGSSNRAARRAALQKVK